MATTASPVSLADLDRLKAALLFTDDDAQALRRAGAILGPRVEELLDVWYGFVGANDFLLESFSTPAGPDGDYLAAVRKRFGQWVHDVTRAEYHEKWLAYQEEIGRRHFTGKNETDGVVGAPDIVHHRYLMALVYPIYATVRPFLEQGSDDAADVERMHQAWLKAVLLSAILWGRPYLREGAF